MKMILPLPRRVSPTVAIYLSPPQAIAQYDSAGASPPCRKGGGCIAAGGIYPSTANAVPLPLGEGGFGGRPMVAPTFSSIPTGIKIWDTPFRGVPYFGAGILLRCPVCALPWCGCVAHRPLPLAPLPCLRHRRRSGRSPESHRPVRFRPA